MMKGKSLSIQIWMWFIGIIVGICIILSLIFYVSLESFFKEQAYNYIEETQKQKILALKESQKEYKKEYTKPIKVVPAIPVQKAYTYPVEHVVAAKGDAKAVPIIEKKLKNVSASVKMEMIQQAKVQISEKQRYEKAVGKQSLYYVISKEQIGNQSVYVYSYVWDNFKKTIISQFWNVFIMILLVMLFMLIPAHIISKRITKPLVVLERDMERIAKRKWDNPINIEGTKEINNLAKSSEWMRQQLITHDKRQQSMLESISHELKTPIMVIRSYIQAMKDGFYPRGSLDKTIELIDKEAERLEKKALDLIYITNLEYMSRFKRLEEDVNLKEIVQGVYERLQYKRADVNWNLDLQDIVIKGDCDLWKVVFENILQNQLRHSKDRIEVLVKKEEENILCRIYNNGPFIEEDKKDRLFNAFEKGAKGESGLGLTIVKRIIDLYEGKVWYENEEEGAAFYISIPFLKTL